MVAILIEAPQTGHTEGDCGMTTSVILSLRIECSYAFDNHLQLRRSGILSSTLVRSRALWTLKRTGSQTVKAKMRIVPTACHNAFVRSMRHRGRAVRYDEGRLIGAWKLVSCVMEDVETKEKTPAWGAHPNGYLVLTASRRWIVVQTAEGREVPQTDA